ncbi:MAG TPA: RHS repeat-associated core domain-containing protein [Paucimonas sp.]|nr:RHS repeat-associated core domain-containing protein [Paucimonas sp.]
MRQTVSILLVAASAMMAGMVQAQAPANPYNYSRASYFEYDPVTGLLKAEVVEPDNPNLCVRTTYQYDGYGNKTGATTANCTGASGNAVFASRTSGNTFNAQTVAVGGTSVTIPAGTFATLSTNALNQSETKTYDPRFGAVTGLTGPNSLVTSWQLDDFGRKIRESRADNTSTVTAYCYLASSGLDTSSNSAHCPTPPYGEIPGDAVSFTHSESRNSADVKNGPFTRVYMDRAGRKIRTVTEAFDGSSQPGGTARLIAQDTDYNAQGAPVVTTQPYFLDTSASTSGGVGNYGMSMTVYDALGRPTHIFVSDPQGSQPGVGFNGRGSRTAAVTTVSYVGLTTTTTNDKNQTRKEEKNVDGKVVRITDAYGAQLAHQHDAFGNLVQTKDALQNVVTVGYDIRGRKLSMADPDSGLWQYDYNALGELVWQQNPTQRAAGQATTMAYDVLGRVTRRVEPEYTSTWSYDKYADGSACNKGIGKLCETGTTNGVTKKLVYDHAGRPINARTSVASGPSFATAVSYDASNGWVSSQTYPTGVTVNYHHTGKGYLERMTLGTAATVTPLPATPGGTPGASTNLAAGSLLWQAQAYNAWGKTEQYVYGNNIISKAAVDNMTGRTTGLTAGAGTATNVLNYSYAYDSLGHLTSRTDANGDGSTGAVTDTYAYDDIGRLKSYRVDAPAIPNLSRTVALQYNALGMLLYKSDVGVYSYGAQGAGATRPHALQSVAGAFSASYTYDANGNVKTASNGAWRSVSYTSFNLPDSSTGLQGPGGSPQYTWQYDEEHKRIKETRVNGSGTRVTWMLHPDAANGLGFESEQSGGTTSNRHYLTAGGMSIGVLVSTGALPTLGSTQTAPPAISNVSLVKVEYWHKDHLGSLASTTDHTGAVTARYSYDPFGKRRYTNGNYDANGNLVIDWTTNTNNGDDRGWTGHEHLDDVGVVHMNGRLFDPRLGLFMQPDSFVQEPENLQNFNRYGYCFNNPMTCTDPTGQIFGIDDLFIALVAIWGAQKLGIIDVRTARMLTSIVFSVFMGPPTTMWQAATNGFVSGAIATGDIKGALQGAFTAGMFYGAGNLIAGGNFFTGAGASAATEMSKAAGIALHGVVGCVTSVVGGGKCGPGALSAAFSKAITPATAQWTKGNPLAGVMVSAIVGGTASVLGGGKFANGAQSGAFGYLFNCLAHECLTKNWDKKAAGYHSYTVDSPLLCNTAEYGCLQSAQMELLCNSAPGQDQCATVGATVTQNLSGGNKITQYAITANAVINGTSPGHLFEDGYVIRALMIDSNNNVFIRTYGEGVNLPKWPASAGFMGWLNTTMGGGLFKNIGINNQINVRFRMNEMMGMKLPK